MSDPDTLADMWALAQDSLSRGVAERKHPARHPTLATLGPDGPETRTVVLRGWDGAVAELHTDRASAKVSELTGDPRAALHVWMPKARVQLRLSVVVALVHGDADRWARVPQAARGVYGGRPTPGSQMAAPQDFVDAPARDRFTVLFCTAHRIEVLHLGDDLHRRALFRRDGDAWPGTWRAP